MRDDGDPTDEAFALIPRLPGPALAKVFQRYGRPLEQPLPPITDDDRRSDLLLDGGACAIVRVVTVRMPTDVIGNDWFVLERDGEEPLAVAGPLFAAALAALARAVHRD